MRLAGRPSWSLGVGDDEQLEFALFVRDAAGLVVEGDGVPPPLVDRPPGAEVLADDDPTDVGKDWLEWWRTLVGVHLESKHAPRGSDPHWQAIILLPTIGTGWHLAEPGAVLASHGAPTGEVLRAALGSSV